MPRLPKRSAAQQSQLGFAADPTNGPITRLEERWRPIPGWPHYEVSDWGNVRSYWGGPSGRFGGQGRRGIRITPKLLGGSIDIGGYRKVTLFRRRADGSNERRPFPVQVLVLTSFVGPCPEGCEACHYPDHDRLNNRLINLRWDTRRANSYDRLRHGRNQYAKLTEADIPEIWRRLVAGESQVAIGRDYGVSPQTICTIKGGKSWTYITSKLPGWPLMPIDRDKREPIYIPERITKSKKEIWCIVPDYPGFRVSNRGRVQCRFKRMPGPIIQYYGRILGDEWYDREPNKYPKGRLGFGVTQETGNQKTVYLHAMILLAFAGPCPTGMIGCHGDGNPENNHAANLRWDTHSSNARDRVKHAKQRLEEKNG